MYLKTKKSLISFLTAIVCFTLVIISCKKNDIPKSKLVLKDNLIYEKGSNTPFTGREKARVEDKIIEYDVVNGIKHGMFRLYYEDGTPEISGQLDSNRNVGKWQYFFQSGELESEGHFVDDLPEGRWVWFYTDGKLKEEGSYHRGIRVGWWRQYDQSGRVSFETEFHLSDSLSVESDSLFFETEK